MDGNEFTESAWAWVLRLLRENQRSIDNLSGRIDKTNAEIESGTNKKGKALTEKQIQNRKNKVERLLGKVEERKQVLFEVIELAASDQVYDVIDDNSMSTTGAVPGTGTIKAGATFNFTNGNFEIRMPTGSGLNLFSHEIKHAYQFEKGAYSIGPEIPGTLYKNFLYEKYDEVSGYSRGAMFGGKSYSVGTLPNDYANVADPGGPVDITTHPDTRFLIQSSDKKLVKDQLQRISNTLRHAFRVNGVTYKPE